MRELKWKTPQPVSFRVLESDALTLRDISQLRLSDDSLPAR